ncbi:MAG: hypothetical protein NUV47_03235 [Patescibacteria group bacterium]|nr:hypothetical protein [Patescibacteria group bacterium]
MNKKIIIALALIVVALPVFAQTSSTSPRMTAQAEKMRMRGTQEVERRVTNLNKLVERIDNMKHIDDNQKETIKSALQEQINPLRVLKVKIENNRENESGLKEDVKAVTDSYKNYSLIIPQGQIIAQADKLSSLIDIMMGLSTKIQAKITLEQETLFAEFNSKIEDAKNQVDAVVSSVSALVPDEGDKTKMQANRQVLKDAREKLRVGAQDIRGARKNVGDIIKSIREKGRTSSTTPETSDVQ